MKKYLIVLLFMIWCGDVNAVVYQGTDNSPISYFEDENNEIIVNSGAVISAADTEIRMMDVMYIYNNGIINGLINTNGYNLFVYNTGNMSGITTDGGGHVTQIMRNVNEITDINVIGNNFSVEIEHIDNLNFDDIKNLNANSFLIKESSIIINDFNDWQNWNKNVHLSGPITLVVNDYQTITDGAKINHVVDGDVISVRATNLESCQKIELTKDGTDYVVNIVRETNSEKIDTLESPNTDVAPTISTVNQALAEIREQNPEDILLNALDAANNTDEINYIKVKSARFNHGILLRPIKLMNKFATIDAIDKNSFDGGVGLIPFRVISDKTKYVGGRVFVGHRHNDLYFNAGFNFNRFEYQDALNDFYGFSSGADLRIKKYFEKLWVNGTFAINLIKYKTNYISNKNTVKNNPFGMTWFLETDVGYDFDILSNVALVPFVGIGYQYYSVADVDDTLVYGRAGTQLQYSFVTDGIKYEYSILGAIGENKALVSGARVGFWSVADEVGVSFDAGLLKDDFGYSYKLSLNAKMSF